MKLEKGFNSNINVHNKKFHIQTEDWGFKNPYIVTRIFQRGSVVKSIKTSYKTAWLNKPSHYQQAIRLAIREQHQKILDQVLSGNIVSN